jgi:hypothetical protein
MQLNLDHNKETTQLFYQQIFWQKESALISKTLSLLQPDGNPYYCKLHPLFSFTFEDRYLLHSFNHVLLRDGVYPLLRFFSLYPIPQKADPKLIIDKDFFNLIPIEWHQKCLLYKRTRTPDLAITNKRSIAICFNVLPNIVDDDSYLTTLNNLLPLAENKIDQIYLYLTSSIPWGEGEKNNVHKEHFQVLQNIIGRFKNINISIVNFNELLLLNLKGMAYLIINPYKLYFSDSYLHHQLAQMGGVDLMAPEMTTPENFYASSINYGFELESIKNSTFDSKITDEIKYCITSLFENKIYEKSESTDLSKAQLSTPEFKSLAYYFAKKLYT